MRVILASPRGFCAGVQMAVDVVALAREMFPAGELYVYHQIVHNRHVVERFERQGVVFVEDLDEVPVGSAVVFSAHGVSPAIRAHAATRRLRVIDATCPLVTKVHSEALRYARQGYEILLIGHRGHQEVVGTSGEAPESIRVIESVEEARRVEVRDPERVAYLTQTTLSTDEAGAIIAALRARFPRIKAPPGEDICYATTNRQQAVRVLAPACDLVLVVGSKNSSNSVRLTEIAEGVGTPARLIDDASHLDDSWFEGVESVLVTAGASAPEDLVAAVCRALIGRYGGTLEQRDLVEEDMEFNLPKALREEMRRVGREGDQRRIRVSRPQVTREMYGAVPLTIEGR